MLEQKDKVKKMEKLFDEIVELFPENSVSIQIHSIDMGQLNGDEWKIEVHLLGGTIKPYLTAKRKSNAKNDFNITLFGEV